MKTKDNTEQINRIIKLQERLFHPMRHDEREVWLELNMTIAQLKSLVFIHSEGTTNFKTLAAVMKVTPPDVTRVIDRLVEQGLVTREENPENRRMQMLKVTDQGEVLLRGLRERGPHRMMSALKLLATEDLTALEQGLAALVRAAENKEDQPAA